MIKFVVLFSLFVAPGHFLVSKLHQNYAHYKQTLTCEETKIASIFAELHMLSKSHSELTTTLAISAKALCSDGSRMSSSGHLRSTQAS